MLERVRDETVKHIISDCREQVPKKRIHNWVGESIGWELCKWILFYYTNGIGADEHLYNRITLIKFSGILWYQLTPKSSPENQI